MRVTIVYCIALATVLSCATLCLAEERDEYYKVLNLNRDASDAQIKRAFRKMSLKYHPDKNPNNDKVKEKYLKISEAYDVLSDPDKRQIYDIHGKEGLDRQKQASHSPFGGMFGQQQGVRKGPDFRMEQAVNLENLYLGDRMSLNIERNVICKKCRGSGAKGGATSVCKACKGSGMVTTVQQLGPGFNIQMQKPCDRCGGKGKTFKHKCKTCRGQKVVKETKRLDIIFERGMPDGHEIRFERASEQTPDTIPGDVIVKLRTRKHPRFTRRGDDLLHDMTISLKEALLGFTRHIVHLDGRRVRVSKEGVTQPGEVMTISKEGMPKHNFPSERGVLEVKFNIAFPSKLPSC